MAASVEELMTAMTRDQVLDLLIAVMKGHGFPADSWQSGSLERTMFEAFAEMYSDGTIIAQTLAKAGFNPTSTGGWLDLLSKSHYDNTRLEGTKTRGNIVLDDADSTGPHTIGVGQIVISDATNNYRYRNVTGGTLPDGLTLTLLFEAEIVGSGQNLADGSTLVVVEGPPGVLATNPGPNWITVQGSAAESDASLQARNATKWATLSPNAPAAAYENWARTASSVVTRVYVDDQNPRGPGTLDIYLAGDGGTVAGSVATAVSDYILGVTDGVRRAGIGANLLVQSAVARAVSITGTVYYLPTAVQATVSAAVQTALDTFFKELEIGGTKTTSASQGYLLLSELYKRILSVTGVVNVVFTSPTADVAPALNDVIVPTIALAYTPAVF